MKILKTVDVNLVNKYRKELFGIASCMIVFHHLTIKGNGNPLIDIYMFLRLVGAMGVDLFLFLSGIGLVYSYEKNNSIKEFYKRRCKRILPAYLCIAFPFSLWRDCIVGKNGIPVLVKHLLLVQFWKEGAGDWYIAAIFILYVLLPLIYYSIRNIPGGGYILILIYIALMMALRFKMIPDTFQLTSTLWARIPVFITGVIAAIKMKERVISISILPVCIFVNILSLILQGYFALQGSELYYSFLPRLCYGPLAITFVMMTVCCFETYKFKVLQKIFGFLGEMTLEIYLLNSRLIGFFDELATKITGNNDNCKIVLANVFGVTTTIILALYIHKIITKMRNQKLCNRIRIGKQKAEIVKKINLG